MFCSNDKKDTNSSPNTDTKDSSLAEDPSKSNRNLNSSDQLPPMDEDSDSLSRKSNLPNNLNPNAVMVKEMNEKMPFSECYLLRGMRTPLGVLIPSFGTLRCFASLALLRFVLRLAKNS
jgi:hypothetical protein